MILSQDFKPEGLRRVVRPPADFQFYHCRMLESRRELLLFRPITPWCAITKCKMTRSPRTPSHLLRARGSACTPRMWELFGSAMTGVDGRLLLAGLIIKSTKLPYPRQSPPPCRRQPAGKNATRRCRISPRHLQRVRRLIKDIAKFLPCWSPLTGLISVLSFSILTSGSLTIYPLVFVKTSRSF